MGSGSEIWLFAIVCSSVKLILSTRQSSNKLSSIFNWIYTWNFQKVKICWGLNLWILHRNKIYTKFYIQKLRYKSWEWMVEVGLNLNFWIQQRLSRLKSCFQFLHIGIILMVLLLSCLLIPKLIIKMMSKFTRKRLKRYLASRLIRSRVFRIILRRR